MELRDATPEDVDGIRAVARASLDASYGHAVESDVLDRVVDDWYATDRVAEDVADGDALLPVAVDGGDVIGFAQSLRVDVREPTGRIEWLHVHPDYRGEGLGADLLGRVEGRLHELGVGRIEGAVLVANEAGTAFYERQGYEPAGERDVDVDGAALRERRYVKTVSGDAAEASVEERFTSDGQRIYVAFDESDRGSQGPFYVAYSDPDGEDRYSYFCGNCENLDVAVDTMETVVCNACGNRRKPVRWDSAYL